MTRNAHEAKSKYVMALLTLSEVKPLKKITVGDLLDKTDTARQTFYNHFRDINELIAYVYIYFFEAEYEKYFSLEGCIEVFENMKAHKAFFCQLPSHTGQNNFTESHLHWLQQSYYRVGFEGIAEGSQEYTRRKVFIDGFLYGTVGLFLDWLNNDMSWPPDVLPRFIFENRPDFIPPEPGPNFEIVPLD